MDIFSKSIFTPVFATLLLFFLIGGQGKQTAMQCNKAVGQETVKTIFLVRHAEKMKDQGSDPELAPDGKTRAERLSHILSEAGLTKIYSTEYIRTQSTARPLAERLGLTVHSYDPKNLAALAQEIREGRDQQILVVGHSNTTPKMVNQLLGRTAYEPLSESEYGKLFVVNLFDKQTKCTIIRY